MIDQRQAKLLAEAHSIEDLIADVQYAEVLQKYRPDLFDAYCSLLCSAGIEIPDPSEEN